MAVFRAMSFDGGGIRGVLTASILARLERRSPGVCRSARLLVGSSTGAFIALGIARGLEPQTLVQFYMEYSEYIFTPARDKRLRPKYANAHLREVLGTLFEADLRLGDLGRYVIVPTFRVKGIKGGPWGPVMLSNLPNSRTASARVIDAAMATSAAPGLFPSYKDFIDGGVAANNPAITAVAAIWSPAAGRSEKDIRLLSIGTGYVPQSIKVDTSDWGEIQWALFPKPKLPFVSALAAAQSDCSTLYCRQLLGDRFFRLNPRLPRPIAADDYKKVPWLAEYGAVCPIGNALEWLGEQWRID